MNSNDRTMLLSPEYEEILKKEHAKYSKWGASASQRHIRDIINFFDELKIPNGLTVLDYGCGKQMLKEVLPYSHKEFYMYDPGIPRFSRKPPKCDIVFCLDVLEHIEPEYLDSVLEHISSRMLKLGFFYIHCTPAMLVLEDGRNAHLIVEDNKWWFNKLEKYFDIIMMKKIKRGVYFWAKPL